MICSQYVCDDADAPHVDSRAILASFQDLGTYSKHCDMNSAF